MIDGKNYTRELGGGVLNASLRSSDFPVDALCDFALRNNPNRKLLVVSRVAGRHLPVRPSQAVAAFDALANKIPADLPGPVVVIGLAESAIGLGHGVYESYQLRTGRTDLLFIHSSRHKLDCPVLVYFEEEHSHATQEYLYAPVNADDQELLRNAATVIIVDDELTTGRTIRNLAHTLMRSMPNIRNIIVANLTDWRSMEWVEQFEPSMPAPTKVVSLLEGELSFRGGPEVVKMPKLLGNNQFKDDYCSAHFGRRGLRQLTLKSKLVEDCARAARGRTLVLATEEFAYPPFALALTLEQQGHDVVFQSTSRTPVIVGHGAMRCAMTFTDNYGDSINNFSYNVAPGMYDSVIICHETPEGTVDESLVRALGARTVRF
ncbi:MAG: phosphoribosyltransferase family protein [Candidatus Obscuribacterales bacterium]|nr:phosphoribosyltransferase family protein [Candidatus Obscuribacterales bacterium]